MQRTLPLSGDASVHHQLRIAYLVTNLNNHLFFNMGAKFKDYICSPETKVSYKNTHKEPDALIFNPIKGDTSSKVWIVICKRQPSRVKIDKDKIKNVFRTIPSLEEGFIYVYETSEWLRYNRVERGFTKNAFSNYLNLDLNNQLFSIHKPI